MLRGQSSEEANHGDRRGVADVLSEDEMKLSKAFSLGYLCAELTGPLCQASVA